MSAKAVKGFNNPSRLCVLNAYRNNPSAALSELTDISGLSKSVVYYHIRNLRYEGIIERRDKRGLTAMGMRKLAISGKVKPTKKVDADHYVKCFERAVELGLANDEKASNMEDVIRHNRWPVYHFTRAKKLG